eukprot:PhF_6_TR12267/c0_g1_i1/m.19440
MESNVTKVWDVKLQHVKFHSPGRTTSPGLVRSPPRGASPANLTSPSLPTYSQQSPGGAPLSPQACHVLHVVFEILYRMHRGNHEPFNPSHTVLSQHSFGAAFIPVHYALHFIRWSDIGVTWTRVLEWFNPETTGLLMDAAEFIRIIGCITVDLIRILTSVSVEDLETHASDYVVRTIGPRLWSKKTSLAALPEISAALTQDSFLSSFMDLQTLHSLKDFEDALQEGYTLLKGQRKGLLEASTVYRILIHLAGLDPRYVSIEPVPNATTSPRYAQNFLHFVEIICRFCGHYCHTKTLRVAMYEMLTLCGFYKEDIHFFAGRLNSVILLLEALDSEKNLEKSILRDLVCRRVFVYYQCVGKVSYDGLNKQQYYRLMVDIGAAATVRDYSNATPNRPSPTRPGLISQERLERVYQQHCPPGVHVVTYPKFSQLIRELAGGGDGDQESLLLQKAHAIESKFEMVIDKQIPFLVSKHHAVVNTVEKLLLEFDIAAVIPWLERASIVPSLVTTKDVLRAYLYTMTYRTEHVHDEINRILLAEFFARLATLAFGKHPYDKIFLSEQDRVEELMARMHSRI